MNRVLNIRLLALTLVSALCVACGEQTVSGSGPASAVTAFPDGAEGLRSMFVELARAADAGDFARGKAITASLIPTREQVLAVMKPGVAAELVDGVLAPFATLPTEEQAMARLLVPGKPRTEITVHASTVEDIVASREGSPAQLEFPGGAKKFADAALAPGRTFYEVEVTEPGNDSGTKFHLFYRDGASWRMLGAAWRALKD